MNVRGGGGGGGTSGAPKCPSRFVACPLKPGDAMDLGPLVPPPPPPLPDLMMAYFITKRILPSPFPSNLPDCYPYHTVHSPPISFPFSPNSSGQHYLSVYPLLQYPISVYPLPQHPISVYPLLQHPILLHLWCHFHQ